MLMKQGQLLFLFIVLLMACKPQTKEGETIDTPTLELKEGIPLLIGTYTRKMGHVNGKAKGIHLAYLYKGKVSISKTFEAGPNPSYIATHPLKDFIYVVNEIGGTEEEPKGLLTTLAMDSTMHFKIINTRSSEGVDPCYVSVNQIGTHVLVANYSSGTISSFPIALSGMTGRSSDVVTLKGSGPHDRQKSPHAHFIAEASDGLVYVADLGTDSIHVYKLNGGQLIPHKYQFKVSSGAGPRHLAFHPKQAVLYVVNELNNTVEVWRQTEDAPYQQLQTLSTVEPKDKREGYCGAIKITPDGKYLYVSNRGIVHSISSFKILPSGQIEYIGAVTTLGEIPRDIEIDPTGQYLLIANQNSDNIVTYKIDTSTGELSQPRVTQGVMTPVCIRFL